ncbi:hypothetical protein ACGILS_11505 [Streptomyces albidoflavus]|uniref:hypothetical protein n=1 Tax=Streptomyces albidoflavus TaxID=1886 RepID=UPI0021D5CC45|nr:hypothetical protein [Streptomyces albidoflavus]MCU7701821.1 hypothetical protein [Streptomyces albidoflavus]
MHQDQPAPQPGPPAPDAPPPVPGGPPPGGGIAEDTALELLVHGVGGSTPAEMLDDPCTVRVSGDQTAAVHRRAQDADAEQRPEDYRGKPVPEAYVWSNLTSGNGTRALWLLLLPFMVVNLAHWMRPSTTGRRTAVRLYGLLARLVALSLTVLLTAAACEVALDLVAWQCAGTASCSGERAWLGFLATDAQGSGGWWSQPGRRLALAALVPGALTALLWYLSHRTWRSYESQQPLPAVDRAEQEAEENAPHAALGRPGFWYGRRLGARLRAAHTSAGLLTVGAAVAGPAAEHDRLPGGPALLSTVGSALQAALLVSAVAVVWVVSRRGRAESRLDEHLDRLVRVLPLTALALTLLSLGYAAWSRPGWQSAGRLPGDETFGTLVLAQGVLVVALAATARRLHATTPERRTVLKGLGGPAVAMLACALGGVMSGGVAQRVADWLDNGSTPGAPGGPIPGPPVLLSWQASVLPPLLVILLAVLVWYAVRTHRHARREEAQVAADYPGEPLDATRTAKIASARAMAALTDRAPVVVGVVSSVTLLLGAGALLGAWTTGRVPGEAARELPAVVSGAAATAQALGSWLIGFGFLLFVTWGRRAYRDPAARRTIGILWDVGTFWPRAAHPFAPPCYAERSVPDLTWRIASWTRETGGRVVLSGHSQGSVLAAAAAWQLRPSARRRVALLTYGSPLERLYGRWFPAHFGPVALTTLHGEVDCWRNLWRLTDPIGGPVRVGTEGRPEVDRPPLADPLAHGRTAAHPLPAPILGHSDYQADPAFAEERARLLARLEEPAAALPKQLNAAEGQPAQGRAGRSSG